MGLLADGWNGPPAAPNSADNRCHAHRHRRHGNAYLGEYGGALSAADGRRDRIHRNPRLSGIENLFPKLVSGEWPGTMNLTEPHAGSDLAELRCRAERENGHYRIKGQKIHYLWRTRHVGEHHPYGAGPPAGRASGDERHLALPGPQDTGNDDGSLGQKNDYDAHPSSISSTTRARPASGLRRQRGRDRLSRRRGKRRPHGHVHHDEHGAVQCWSTGRLHRRTGLSTGARFREGTCPRPRRRRRPR